MKTEILEDIGLTKGEIKVYLALLEPGTSTVTPISKRSGITTGKVYPILDKLIEKGLASFILKNNVKYFSPSSPSRIKDYIKEKITKLEKQEDEIEKILPKLQNKLNSLKEEVRAEVFIGWRGMETTYQDMINSLKKNEYDYVLGASKGVNEIKTKRFYGRILNKTYEKGIKFKVIFHEDSRDYFKTSLGQIKHVQAKFLPNTAPSETNIYKDVVMIVIHSDVPIVIRVKSKEVADSFMEYFEIMWRMAKK